MCLSSGGRPTAAYRPPYHADRFNTVGAQCASGIFANHCYRKHSFNQLHYRIWSPQRAVRERGLQHIGPRANTRLHFLLLSSSHIIHIKLYRVYTIISLELIVLQRVYSFNVYLSIKSVLYWHTGRSIVNMDEFNGKRHILIIATLCINRRTCPTRPRFDGWFVSFGFLTFCSE